MSSGGRGPAGARRVPLPRWLPLSILPLLVVCATPPPPLPATRIYQLATPGPAPDPAPPRGGDGTRELVFTLSPAEAAAPHAQLELGALPGPRRVFVNGSPVGALGFDLPEPLDLAGHLRAGRNQLRLVPAEGAEGGTGGLIPPPVDLGSVPLEARLTLAPAVSLSAPRIHASPAPGRFEIRLEARQAPPGAIVEVDLLDGGESVASTRQPVQAGTEQSVAIEVPEGALWTPLDDQVALPWLSARLLAQDGSVLDHVASRVGLADIRYDAGGLRVNGVDTRLWAALFFERGADARETLARIGPNLHRAGLNALELHGWVPDTALLEAAEELGLYLVVLPRCPARIQREFSEQMPAGVEAALAASTAVQVKRLEQSPTVVLWEREKAWMALPGIQRPAAQLDVVEPGSTAVTVGLAESHDAIEFRGLQDGAPPAWIIEIIPKDAEHRQPIPVEAAAEGMARWRAMGQLGLALSQVGLDQPVFTLPPPLLDDLSRGRPADVPSSLPNRGPADLLVTVSSRGAPAEGVVVDLDVPGLPPCSAWTDARGEARLRVWWEGAASVEAAGQTRPVRLQGGRYTDGHWLPHTERVDLELAAP